MALSFLIFGSVAQWLSDDFDEAICWPRMQFTFFGSAFSGCFSRPQLLFQPSREKRLAPADFRRGNQ
jgi:hypothetical protein